MKFLILNGPNLNMLGVREPGIYGTVDYEGMVNFVKEGCAAIGVETEFYQSNHEGSLVDAIQSALGLYDGIVINPGAYTHTSIAILDALKAVALPAAPFWEGDAAFRFIFGLAPRIAAASLAAFLLGSFLNAYVMSRMKIASRGKHFSARAVLSTLAGESADSLIFFPLAFGGLVPVQELVKMMAIQIFAKTAYEIVVLPVTIRVVNFLKKIEESDAYDTDISYNILKIREL